MCLLDDEEEDATDDVEVVPATQQSGQVASYAYFAPPPPLPLPPTLEEEEVEANGGCGPLLSAADKYLTESTASYLPSKNDPLIDTGGCSSTATLNEQTDDGSSGDLLLLAQGYASPKSPNAAAVPIATTAAPLTRFLSEDVTIKSPTEAIVPAATSAPTTVPAPPSRTVLLPWDPRHRFVAPNGRPVPQWSRVLSVLSELAGQPHTAASLVDLIRGVQPPDAGTGSAMALSTLSMTLTHYLPQHLSHKFLTRTVPWMIKVLEEAEQCFAGAPPLPILCQGYEGRVQVTQQQAATLLVCGFFCLMPERYHPANAPRTAAGRHGANLPAFNFNGLFGASYHVRERRPQTPLYGKIACLINYFVTMADAWEGVKRDGLLIEIVRCARSNAEVNAAFASGANNALSPLLEVSADRLIEDCAGQLQADFANQMLGGGVLGKGCVQEEIRMVVSPELLIGLLVCEPLRSREAVLVSGCAQYSTYTGYAREFAFSGSAIVLPPSDYERHALKMRDITVVAFDAINYNGAGLSISHQFLEKYIAIEVVKAFVAFSGSAHSTTIAAKEGGGGDRSSSVVSTRMPIATGHWGCGAFGGDRELKFLIQLCAASYAGGRPITYCTFGDVPFTKRCVAIHRFLSENKVGAGRLYTILVGYIRQKDLLGARSLFDYLSLE